jgi:hypothetical protein
MKVTNDLVNNIDFNLFVVNDSTTTSTNASASTTNGGSNSGGSVNGDININYQLLTSNMTLEQIIEKYWKLNKPLELYYISKS